MFAALAAALFAAGVLVIVAGLFPPKPTLANRLAEFNEDPSLMSAGTSASALDTYSLMLLETLKGDKLEAYESDVLVSGGDMPSIAVDKAKAAAGCALLLGAGAWLLEWVSNPLSLLIVVTLGSAIGYHLPDLELKKKAEARRVEFSHSLTAFMTLLSSSISGGGGLNSALADAAAMGDGWVFDHIRSALNEARLEGISAWLALERLGLKLQVIPLVELSGSLTLAGTSGARVTETLVSRAASSREAELAEVRGDAEATSSKLGVPVGMIMMTWVFFIGYPAVQTIVAA